MTLRRVAVKGKYSSKDKISTKQMGQKLANL